MSLIWLASGGVRAATPAQVDTAMKKAVDALYAAQKNGNWEAVPALEWVL